MNMNMKLIKISIITIFASTATLWLFHGSKSEDGAAKKPVSSMVAFSSQSVSALSSFAPLQTKKYENNQYGFSFSYPAGFTASEFPEDEGRMSLILKNAATGQIVQIYLASHHDPYFTVSAGRIKRDIPDLRFLNSVDAVVGDKAKGVAFFSENEAFGGPTAEVWFADGRNFYQATAYRKDVKILEEIIKSWKL